MHGLRRIADQHLTLIEQRNAQLTLQRFGAFVDDMRDKAIAAFVGDEHGQRLERTAQVVPTGLGHTDVIHQTPPCAGPQVALEPHQGAGTS